MILAIVGTLLVVFISIANNEIDEFYAFEEFIDEEYTPTSDKAYEYLSKAGGEIESFRFTNWYLLENGIEESFDLQSELEIAKEKIINKDLEHADTLAYKTNILNQIHIFEEFLKDLDINNDELQSLKFSENTDELSKNIKEMNNILGEYNE